MEWSRLLAYMQEGENLTTHFIARVEHDRDLGPIMCAMANTIGGKIFIGIDLKNYHLVGTKLNADWVNKVITTCCKPYFQVGAEFVEKNDKHILCLTIPGGRQKPYIYNDDCYIMEATGPRLASVEEIQEMETANAQPEPIESSPEADSNFQEDLSQLTKELQALTQADTPVRHQTTISTPQSAPVDTPASTAQKSTPAKPNVSQPETKQTSPSTSTQQAETANAISNPTPIAPLKDVNASVATAQSQEPSSAPSSSEPQETAETNSELFDEPEQPLNNRQVEIIDHLIENPHHRIKNKSYREQFGISHKTAHIELVDLVKRNLLVQEGQGRSTCYRITEEALQKKETESTTGEIQTPQLA